MTAANASAPSTSLDEEMRAHEPSMEEILASIRRIIADDDTLPAARRERRREGDSRAAEDAQAPVGVQSAYPEPALDPGPPVADVRDRPEAAQGAEIRQLRVGRVAAEPAAAAESAEEPEQAAFDDEAEIARALDALAEEAERADEAECDAPLVSSDAASSVASHFQALAASMVINDSGLLHKYAQDMLRPMLKQWLDDNLPVIVERLVRAEIERVARGGRR